MTDAWGAPDCFLDPEAPDVRDFRPLPGNRSITGVSSSMTFTLPFSSADYSVVIKNRAPPPKAWRWEIHRAGAARSIKQSTVYFDSMTSARRAGADALEQYLDERFSRQRGGVLALNKF
jgi:hypothetical protein